jgi:hypothetical protein
VITAQTAELNSETTTVDSLPSDPSPLPPTREAVDKVFVRADTSLLLWVFR